jgi:deferrochelatase/peroxidase EfeB
VVLHPDAPGPAPDRASANDFQYLELDPDGERCPIGAHVRRANPRDARGGSADESWKVVNRHRLLRRGRGFGEAPTVEAALAGADATATVGLLFVSLQASIARGFEFVQQIWNANPGFNGLFQEPDPVVGPGDHHFTIPGTPVRLRLPVLPRFVIPRGGLYAFVPSRAALEVLAAGGPVTTRRPGPPI